MAPWRPSRSGTTATGPALGDCQQYGGNGATGGGYSEVWPKSAWQPALPNQRAVPDLSSSADPAHGVAFYFAKNGGWSSIGGTSIVSPEIGGFLADVNQGCAATVGLVAPTLYAADNAANFTDVTTGNNDFTGTNNGSYAATAGYDTATGLGTPQDQNLGIALQGADGCPSVGGVERVLGGGLGWPPITAHRWRPGRRHQNHLRLRRGGDDPVALGDLPRRRAALTGAGPLCRRHRDQPARDLGHLLGRHLRLRQLGQL